MHSFLLKKAGCNPLDNPLLSLFARREIIQITSLRHLIHKIVMKGS